MLHVPCLQSSSFIVLAAPSHFCCSPARREGHSWSRSLLACLLTTPQMRVWDTKIAAAGVRSAQIRLIPGSQGPVLTSASRPLPADQMRAEGVKIAVAGARSAQVLVKEAALGANPEPLRQHQLPTPV